jgi:hypothetical protein
MYIYLFIYISINEMQQRTVYILYFIANLLHMFRVPFTPIISTGNCSCRTLVQVICHERFDGVDNNQLESTRSQFQTHFTMVKLRLDYGEVCL